MLKRSSSPEMRSTRRRPRRSASAFVIFSPVYSAILRRRAKGTVAKQPRPWIGEARTASPGASFMVRCSPARAALHLRGRVELGAGDEHVGRHHQEALEQGPG